MIHQRTNDFIVCISRILNHSERNEHQSLGKDDWHHVSSEELERYVLAGAAILLVPYNTLCILYRNLSCTLGKEQRCTNNDIEYEQLDDEHHKTTVGDGCEA